MSEENNERIATLESSNKTLHKDVKNITDSLASLGRDFRAGMENVQRQLNESNRTPWGVLASWAGVILLLMGIIGSFYVRDLEKLDTQTTAQGVALLHHQEEAHEKEVKYLERIHAIELQLAALQAVKEK